MTAAWLAGIGRYSYAIYLFHVFFTAATRIGLERIGIVSLLVHALLGVLMGLAGPILVDRLFTPFKWPALLLLGKSLKPKTSALRVKAPVSAAG
jgi:peptidoglycan/LPS O-acetylase OafA/YrhL